MFLLYLPFSTHVILFLPTSTITVCKGICLLADLNLNTSLKCSIRWNPWQNPHWLHWEWDQLEEQGSRERHESLSFPSCWVCENEDEILFEGPSTCVSRDMSLLFLFCKIIKKVSLLSASNKTEEAGWVTGDSFGLAWLADCQCQGRFTQFSPSCCTAIPKITWQC